MAGAPDPTALLRIRDGAAVVLEMARVMATPPVRRVQFGDLIQFVNFPYLAGVTRVNVASLAALANGPAQPANDTSGAGPGSAPGPMGLTELETQTESRRSKNER